MSSELNHAVSKVNVGMIVDFAGQGPSFSLLIDCPMR